MNPPFPYYGGKVRIAPVIVSMMPPHTAYIEPFFGSGAVLFAKRPSRHEIINDTDGALVNFFRVLRERREELEEACALSPHARDEFLAADLDTDCSDIERARRFWVRVNQSFARCTGTWAGWSVTTNRTQSIPDGLFSKLGRFGAVADRLARVSIENTDAVSLIERLACNSNTVIYCDQPYVHSTRSNRKNGARDYRSEMTDDDHRRLAKALHTTPATVILSGYPGTLYWDLYSDWWRFDLSVFEHSSNSKKTPRGGRIECLWSNRDLTMQEVMGI